MKNLLLLTVSLVFLAGCQIVDRRLILDPGQNEVLRVESGERLYFDLDENRTTGYSWEITSDDENVSVAVEHIAPSATKDGERLCGAPGKASFTIRVHRGFDGPATIRVFYKRPWEKEPIKSFTLSLYKSSRDWAAWK